MRVGAHRAPLKKGRGWITFGWAALASLVLIVAGLYGLSRVIDGISFDLPIFSGETPGATPAPTSSSVEPVLDPATIDEARQISITVLNGTTMVGLHDTAGAFLTGAGWPVGAMAPATADDVPETFIYYSDPANEDIARGLVVALGVGEIRLSDAFLGAPITIVLGTDYVEPAVG